MTQTGNSVTGPSPLLTAAAREAQIAIDNGWGYNAQENQRAQRMRRFLHSCSTCGSPVYEDPGHCVQCAWDGHLRAVPERGR